MSNRYRIITAFGGFNVEYYEPRSIWNLWTVTWSPIRYAGSSPEPYVFKTLADAERYIMNSKDMGAFVPRVVKEFKVAP